jgi:hypothetical protein
MGPIGELGSVAKCLKARDIFIDNVQINHRAWRSKLLDYVLLEFFVV